jgi:hypothetical protein
MTWPMPAGWIGQYVACTVIQTQYRGRSFDSALPRKWLGRAWRVFHRIVMCVIRRNISRRLTYTKQFYIKNQTKNNDITKSKERQKAKIIVSFWSFRFNRYNFLTFRLGFCSQILGIGLSNEVFDRISDWLIYWFWNYKEQRVKMENKTKINWHPQLIVPDVYPWTIYWKKSRQAFTPWQANLALVTNKSLRRLSATVLVDKTIKTWDSLVVYRGNITNNSACNTTYRKDIILRAQHLIPRIHVTLENNTYRRDISPRQILYHRNMTPENSAGYLRTAEIFLRAPFYTARATLRTAETFLRAALCTADESHRAVHDAQAHIIFFSPKITTNW